MFSHLFMQNLWFFVLALVWVIYIVQESFILGSSIWAMLFTKDQNELKAIQVASGLHWDGIEVWLIVAIGGLFAAFPGIYADTLTLLNVAFFLLLALIITRGISIELMFKDKALIKTMKIAWGVSGVLMLVVLGVYLTNIFYGFSITSTGETGSFLQIFNLTGIFGGIMFLGLGLITGAAWIHMMTKTDVSQRIKKTLKPIAFVATVTTAITLLGLNNNGIAFSNELFVNNWFLWIIPFLTLVSVVAMLIATLKEKIILSFIFASLTFTFYIAAGFIGTFPYMIPSNIAIENGITLYSGSSSKTTLTLMTYAAAIFVPIVVVYQGLKYFKFAKKIDPTEY